jgi:hypothetical protein
LASTVDDHLDEEFGGCFIVDHRRETDAAMEHETGESHRHESHVRVEHD